MNFLGSPGFLPRPKAWVSWEARPHPGVLASAASPTGERGDLGEPRQPPAALGPAPRRPVGVQPAPGPSPELQRPGYPGGSCRSKHIPGSRRSPVFPTREPRKVSRGRAAARDGPGRAWGRHLEPPNLPAGTGPTSYPPSLSPSSPSGSQCVPPGGHCPSGPSRLPGAAPPRRRCPAATLTLLPCGGQDGGPRENGRRGHSPPRGGRRGGQGCPRPSGGSRSPQPRERDGGGGGGGSAPAPCVFPAAAGAGSGRWPGAAAAGRLCPH